jgi:uncharacterized protein (DUF58 family)
LRRFLSHERWVDSWITFTSIPNSLWSYLKYIFSQQYYTDKWIKLVQILRPLRNAILYFYQSIKAARYRILIIAVPLVLLALALIGDSSLLLRLFFLSVLVPLISYLWVLLSIRGISVQSEEPPEHCQVGEQFQQEITISNNSRIPRLWLKVEDNTDMPGEHNATFLNLSPRSSYHWQNEVQCQRRGYYTVGTVIVTTTDPFGFFSKQRILGEPRHILVYPATYDLPLFKLSSFSDFGYGSTHQSVSLISPNASSVREFATGDSLQHIHWRSTAHTGRFMVKVFDVDRSYGTSKTIWVAVDMEEAPHFGEGEESTEEYSVTLAASLIRKHLQSGMRVGMISSGDQTYLFPPDRGEEHFGNMLVALALMKATGKLPVSQLILEQIQYFKDDSVVVIVTPSASMQLVDDVRFLRNRVESVVAILLDAASFGGDEHLTNTVRELSATGVQLYIVRQGDELAKALDNRVSQSQARYI